MSWRGFHKESKSFMNYENLSIKDKLKFWIRYPYAYYIYIKNIYFDNCKSSEE